MVKVLTVPAVTWLTSSMEPTSSRCVRFLDYGDRVEIETLSTVTDKGGELLHVVENVVEAYRVSRVNGYNLRYTQTVGPVSPLVVLS